MIHFRTNCFCLREASSAIHTIQVISKCQAAIRDICHRKGTDITLNWAFHLFYWKRDSVVCTNHGNRIDDCFKNEKAFYSYCITLVKLDGILEEWRRGIIYIFFCSGRIWTNITYCYICSLQLFIKLFCDAGGVLSIITFKDPRINSEKQLISNPWSSRVCELSVQRVCNGHVVLLILYSDVDTMAKWDTKFATVHVIQFRNIQQWMLQVCRAPSIKNMQKSLSVEQRQMLKIFILQSFWSFVFKRTIRDLLQWYCCGNV